MTTVTISDGIKSSTQVVPDGSPSYAELWMENQSLKLHLSAALSRANENWDIVESIACGETISCPTCNKRKPCLCD
jgi:hypothetical protein